MLADNLRNQDSREIGDLLNQLAKPYISMSNERVGILFSTEGTISLRILAFEKVRKLSAAQLN